jgi:hypothetical protein
VFPRAYPGFDRLLAKRVGEQEGQEEQLAASLTYASTGRMVSRRVVVGGGVRGWLVRFGRVSVARAAGGAGGTALSSCVGLMRRRVTLGQHRLLGQPVGEQGGQGQGQQLATALMFASMGA